MSSSSIIISNLTMSMTTTNSSSIIVYILIGIFLSFIALITALGNVIVLLAFYCDKKLRTINDYFILNMAIADFLVGFFCIPFYIPFSLTHSWPFGRLFCKIWVTIDDVSTMASVINIVAITVNRYWSIAYPLSYRKYVRQHFVYLVMIAVWAFSFLNFAPGIWLLSLFDEKVNETNLTRNDCSGDYNKSFVYMLIAQFNYFIWPFILLCLLNMLLMINIWKRSRKMSRFILFNRTAKVKEDNICSSPAATSKDTEDEQQRLSILSKQKLNSNDRCPSIIIEESENILPTPSNNANIRHLSCQLKSETSQNNLQYLSSTPIRKNSCKTKKRVRHSSPMIYLSRKTTTTIEENNDSSIADYRFDTDIDISRPSINPTNTTTTKATKKSKKVRTCQSRIVRDRKAARSLFILVIVFLIFLFPYVICATASTAGAKISDLIFEISFWLLWLNSTCNPFLYPFIQIKYRRAYSKLFQSFTKYFTFTR